MSNVINWIILAIFSAIIIYFFMAQAYTIASPNVSAESISFTNNTFASTANSPIVVVNSLKNATHTLPTARYTYSTTQVKIYTNTSYSTTDWDVNYDYQASATVFGLNLSFMGVLVIIGVALALMIKHLFKSK